MRNLLFVAVVACSSHSSVPSARYAIAPPVEAVADQRPIRPPAERTTYLDLYHFDGSFYAPLMRTVEVPPKRRARGVNSVDEVPDSTWFTNRIGVRDLTIDELRAGPITITNPQAYTPWTIHSMKSKGESLGFTITDTRGEKFLIKFDRVGFPELETANHVIAGRILWACGYNVPEDFISHIKLTDLVVGADATEKDDLGRKQPLRRDAVDRELKRVIEDPHGGVRVLASRVLPGNPLGGHAASGRRSDDPNDRVPHELRRDLRGALPIFAWLDHADIKQDNTLDVYTPGGYVVHYFLDFGKSLGGLSAIANDPRRGFEYAFDLTPLWGSLVSLGSRPRPFADRKEPRLRGIGFYDEVSYDPGSWHPDTPAYLPFLDTDRVDWFWGAKILMRFTRPQLEAIVATGELTDPRSRKYLVDTLIARQRTTAAFAFSKVAPLDDFQLRDDRSLCFQDLVVKYQLGAPASYAIRTYDRKARPLGARRLQQSVCTQPLDVSRAPDGYTIVQIETRGRSVFVHIAKEPLEHSWRIVGLYRG